jgi:ABC-type transport system substrate-binding protein
LNKREIRSIFFVILVIEILFIGAYTYADVVKESDNEPFFSLVAITNGGGVHSDYLNFLQQHLARIGINVDIRILDRPLFIMELLVYHNYDICYIAFSSGTPDPDMSGMFSENGSLNLFGYDTSIDYDEEKGTGLNEWYLQQGNLITPSDSQERIQHYWDWEQYLMDKILPCQPAFTPMGYTAIWSNLKRYDCTKGLVQSWGKLYWDGTHQNQKSTNEIVIRDEYCSNLNPLFFDHISSTLMKEGIFDPLIYYDYDGSVWPHVAKDWELINDNYLRINVRQGIKWQPDFEGNFTDEYLDIEDVYFTLYAWANLSEDTQKYSWIKDMTIVNSTCLDIVIDGEPKSPELNPYSSYLSKMAVEILPEHYLNQSQLVDGATPDMNHPSWEIFAHDSFGTGLFDLENFHPGEEDIILHKYDDCWLLNDSVSKQGMDFGRRFGNFTVNGPSFIKPNRIRIRTIPGHQASLFEFKDGKLDIEDVTPYPKNRDELVASADFEVQNDSQSYFGFFGFNLRKERPAISNQDPAPYDPSITKGLAVRKAISYAIDRNEINDVVHQGDYILANHPFYFKQELWYNPNMFRYNHDPDLAREFMEVAGFVHGYAIWPRPEFREIETIFIVLLFIFTAIFLAGFIFVSVFYLGRRINSTKRRQE